MNSFSRQGKALPIKVREEIIEKWLAQTSVAEIPRQLRLPHKTVSIIVDVWLTRPSIEPQLGSNKSRTASTDDVIMYTEFSKQSEPSVYAKENTTKFAPRTVFAFLKIHQARRPSVEY